MRVRRKLKVGGLDANFDDGEKRLRDNETRERDRSETMRRRMNTWPPWKLICPLSAPVGIFEVAKLAYHPWGLKGLQSSFTCTQHHHRRASTPAVPPSAPRWTWLPRCTREHLQWLTGISLCARRTIGPRLKPSCVGSNTCLVSNEARLLCRDCTEQHQTISTKRRRRQLRPREDRYAAKHLLIPYQQLATANVEFILRLSQHLTESARHAKWWHLLQSFPAPFRLSACVRSRGEYCTVV